MTFTPAVLACASTAAPDGASIESMSRTFTPSLIMFWAIEANLVLSFWAFWMSDLMPAAWNAFVNSGVSNSVYRVDEVVSGRITPTWALPLAAPPPLLDELPADVDAPPLPAVVLLLLLLPLLLQLVSSVAAATPAA